MLRVKLRLRRESATERIEGLAKIREEQANIRGDINKLEAKDEPNFNS